MTRNIPHVTRGSCGSSLVCYLLGISNVDPIKYNITFERFLNDYRDTLPDIDLDFPHFFLCSFCRRVLSLAQRGSRVKGAKAIDSLCAVLAHVRPGLFTARPWPSAGPAPGCMQSTSCQLLKGPVPSWPQQPQLAHLSFSTCDRRWPPRCFKITLESRSGVDLCHFLHSLFTH